MSHYYTISDPVTDLTRMSTISQEKLIAYSDASDWQFADLTSEIQMDLLSKDQPLQEGDHIVNCTRFLKNRLLSGISRSDHSPYRLVMPTRSSFVYWPELRYRAKSLS